MDCERCVALEPAAHLRVNFLSNIYVEMRRWKEALEASNKVRACSCARAFRYLFSSCYGTYFLIIIFHTVLAGGGTRTNTVHLRIQPVVPHAEGWPRA